MSIATLTPPVTLDPRMAATLRVRVTNVDHQARVVGVTIDYYDSGGNVIQSVSDQLSGPQVETWIGNQEATILTRYMAAKGLTGTIG